MFKSKQIKPAHDVIPYADGTKAMLVVTSPKPHSREYKRLMKKEAEMWQERFADALIAFAADNQEEALKAYEKKWGIKL